MAAVTSVAGVAIAAAFFVTGSYELSRDRIEANERARLLRTLHQVLDPASYDNDPTEDRRYLTDPELLGTEQPVEVFLATRGGAPVTAVFAPVAPRGYTGPIDLLVGVGYDGTVSGVRATSHRETPGLGDAIDIAKSNWIRGFEGASLTDPPPDAWLVEPDGGHFDALTGATVTPRAVVAAVKNTLIYYRQHRAELFAEPTVFPGSRDEPSDE